MDCKNFTYFQVLSMHSLEAHEMMNIWGKLPKSKFKAIV